MTDSTANEEYIIAEKLDNFIDFGEIKSPENIFDTVDGTFDSPFPPELDDLVRIHKLIRQRKCFTVLEFGVGYSTIVIADALRKNYQEWQQLKPEPAIRNRFMFRLFTVDASLYWLDHNKRRFPEELARFVNFSHSEVTIGTFRGQLCHYYRNLPDIIPDFIYLDGPSPKDVQGDINGLSFKCDERTVMSADLLLMESTFLPGTFILIDGRTNNARFIERNFSREYKIQWNGESDYTTLELKEERLGSFNFSGSDFLNDE